MTQKAIGPNFTNELAAYGVAHGVPIHGAHFTWFANGDIEFFPDTPAAVKAAVAAVYAAHDPAVDDPKAAYARALASGVTIASTGTPALNGVYGISPQDEINYLALQMAVADGVFPGFCRQKNGTKITMTGAQATSVFTAILGYIAALDTYLDNALAGQAATLPSSNLAIA